MNLPVDVLAMPHWRVTFRPDIFEGEKITSLAACLEAVRAAQVRLRGWYYPYISSKPEQNERGNNWVAGWSSYRGHIEYWRFFQSTQFLHLLAIRESADLSWKAQLEEHARCQLEGDDIKWDKVRGYFSFENFLYTVTEIFEFAARLSQRGVYSGKVSVSISLEGIQGFVLTSSPERNFMNFYSSTVDRLENTWTPTSDDLVAQGTSHSMKALTWFLERFGVHDISGDVLRKEQDKFLAGRL